MSPTPYLTHTLSRPHPISPTPSLTHTLSHSHPISPCLTLTLSHSNSLTPYLTLSRSHPISAHLAQTPYHHVTLLPGTPSACHHIPPYTLLPGHPISLPHYLTLNLSHSPYLTLSHSFTPHLTQTLSHSHPLLLSPYLTHYRHRPSTTHLRPRPVRGGRWTHPRRAGDGESQSPRLGLLGTTPL